MTPVTSPAAAIGMLIGYAVIVFALAAWYSRGHALTKVTYLAAGRAVSEWRAAFSIASTWIWAPALFVAAQKAYLEGWVGLFWFTVPNVLCLVAFAHFGERLRARMPQGYTIAGYMRVKYGNGVHTMFLLQHFGLLICCLAVQMLGGGKVVASVTGLPYHVVAPLIAVVAMSYAAAFGLRASIVTDWFKMVLVFVLLAVIVPWAVVKAGGVAAITAGVFGAKGQHTSLFSGAGAAVFWSFGLSTTIGLMSGPFGDQAFYQRAWATAGNRVRGAFYKGALIFAIVPLTMSLLGFAMAGSGAPVTNPAMVNLAAITTYLPGWAAVAFAFLVVSALLSAMDSHYTAIGSLAGNDLIARTSWGAALRNFGETPDHSLRTEDRYVRRWSRMAMVGCSAIAIGIAFIPGVQVLHLFMFYGTLRASTLLPVVMAVMSRRLLQPWALASGIIASFVVGLPLFVYGNLTKAPAFIVAGSLTTVLLSGLIAYIGTRLAPVDPVVAESVNAITDAALLRRAA